MIAVRFCAALTLLTPPALATPRLQEETENLVPQIVAAASEVADHLIEIRRVIHMHPEVSGQEVETAALVADELRALGLEVRTEVGGHGVIGVLRGGLPGPVVAYRADMDAVPSAVIGDAPYRSQVPGVKHVCGHDAHVAIGIGVASVLAPLRAKLPGVVVFLFQPAEENATGARAMIRDGALKDPKPDAIFALHTVPFPVGVIACPEGVGLAGLQPFQIHLEGKSGVAQAERAILAGLQSLSTVAPPTSPEGFQRLIEDITIEEGPYRQFVYLFPPASAPGAEGARVISSGVRASGDETLAQVRETIEELVTAATGEGVTGEVVFSEDQLPAMHSDPALVRAAKAPLEAILGPGKTIPVHATIPFFGEDFSHFQAHMPGAMFFLGVANHERGIGAYNHFPDYDLDEAAIEIGTAAMANVILEHMREQ